MALCDVLIVLCLAGSPIAGGVEAHWSFQAVRPVEPPAVRNAGWVRTPVDRFVLAKLEEARLGGSVEAARPVLIRRLSFDLVGLPPTPEEVEAFVADASPDAYERLVEQLLADPRYGERWGRYWLDVVRYADTNGYERDEFRPAMWRYRDYVIRSFNADKPFDRFVREQLAGDEAGPGPPATAADVDRLVATGYLRLGPYDSTGEIFEENAKARDELMADLVNTTGSGLLGLTISCANCHDHKYDPISQADHFRLRAFFAAVASHDDTVVDLPSERTRIEAHNSAVDAEAAAVESEIAVVVEPVRKRIAEERRAAFPEEVKTLLAVEESARDEAAKETLKPWLERLNVSDADAVAALDEATKAKHAELTAKVAAIKARRLDHARAVTMSDAGATAPPTHVFDQGDYTEPGEEVGPAFLPVVDSRPVVATPPAGMESTGLRTALAGWVASAENPLTARVFVNRLWLHHFGDGLVATPNDFGRSGASPTHPELLDWLAAEFVRRGWSVKAMHRAIVLSATYRQGSGISDFGLRISDRKNANPQSVDPSNRLYWRQNVRRLDAEATRDAMLAVSGRLRGVAGGKPAWPQVPDEVLDAQPAIIEARHDPAADARGQGWYAVPAAGPEAADVRSVYLVQKRSVPLPLLQPFDLPDTTVSCGRRDVTTVAPQSLQLLNSVFAERMALGFAERVRSEAGTDPAVQVRRAIRLALGREAEPIEIEEGTALLARHAELRRDRSNATGGGFVGEPVEAAKTGLADPCREALVDFCRVLLNVNEFVYVD